MGLPARVIEDERQRACIYPVGPGANDDVLQVAAGVPLAGCTRFAIGGRAGLLADAGKRLPGE